MAYDFNIKNLPISYLKQKGSGFFDSTQYKRAVTLFNSLKHKVTGSADTSKEDLKIDIPIDTLKKVLMGNFFDQTLTYSENEELDVILIKVLAKDIRKPPLVRRRVIDKTVSELSSTSYFTVRERRKVPLIQEALGISKNYNDLDSNTKTILPISTGDAVHDVVNKSKYYDGLMDQNMYDDVKYVQKMLKMIGNSITASIHMQTLQGISEFIQIDYSDTMKEFEQDIIDLKKNLIYKFSNASLVQTNNDTAVRMDEAEFLKRSIEIALNKKSPNVRLDTTFFVQVSPASTWTITDTEKGFANYICEIFDPNGNRITDKATFTVDSTKTVLTVKFSSAQSGRAIFIRDILNPDLINKITLQQYAELLPKGILQVYQVDGVNDTFKINVDRVNFEYFRLEVYERIQLSAFDFELTKLDLESVNVNLEQITFTTKQKDISTVQAYLLPIRNLATSGVNVKVNSDNVGNFLQLYDIFDNEVIFLNAGDLNGS
jgi:hypothetical protein